MNEIIPKIESTVMKMIAKYCKEMNSNLSQLFFAEDDFLSETLNQSMKQKKGSTLPKKTEVTEI
jgi:hypothetical protein